MKLLTPSGIRGRRLPLVVPSTWPSRISGGSMSAETPKATNMTGRPKLVPVYPCTDGPKAHLLGWKIPCATGAECPLPCLIIIGFTIQYRIMQHWIHTYATLDTHTYNSLQPCHPHLLSLLKHLQLVHDAHCFAVCRENLDRYDVDGRPPTCSKCR